MTRQDSVSKIARGDYLAPVYRDGKCVMWRARREVERDVGTGEPLLVWQLWRWDHPVDTLQLADTKTLDRWALVETGFGTRQAALDRAEGLS